MVNDPSAFLVVSATAVRNDETLIPDAASPARPKPGSPSTRANASTASATMLDSSHTAIPLTEAENPRKSRIRVRTCDSRSLTESRQPTSPPHTSTIRLRQAARTPLASESKYRWQTKCQATETPCARDSCDCPGWADMVRYSLAGAGRNCSRAVRRADEGTRSRRLGLSRAAYTAPSSKGGQEGSGCPRRRDEEATSCHSRVRTPARNVGEH